MITGWVLGSNYGGWGFNVSDYSEEIIGEDDAVTTEFITLDDANNIDINDLKTTPFFSKFKLSDLLVPDVSGSLYAKNNRNKLLAEVFPALTTPVGGPDGAIMEDYEFVGDGNAVDMQAVFANGWAQQRLEDDNEGWLHSDLRDMSYLYIYQMFDRISSELE